MTLTVLFDLDGTLVDSEQVAVEAFRAAFSECVGPGRAPTDELLAMAGLPFERIVETLGLPPTMAPSFRRHSVSRVHTVRPFPGVTAMLAALSRQGVGLGIITGKDRGRAEQVIALTGLGAFCSELVTPSDPPAPKPAPDGVHHLIGRLRGTTRDTVLVGDSMNDIRAGQNAGVYTVACTWGAGRTDVLRTAGPDALVESVAELETVLTTRLGARMNGLVR
ncbi:HAD family hydrolase [Micromonospora sp. NPDC049175]|uniref:HAD family hydrolase n=1 Tax=Micromonospora sp. NPDC049175 TaxID=3364266 RepID=UPI0037147F29